MSARIYNSQYQSEYRAKNRERIKESQRKSYLKNRAHRVAYSTAYNRKNKEQRRKYQTHYNTSGKGRDAYYKHRYGITCAQKTQMTIAQNNACAICKVAFVDSKDTCLDHNHSTGTVRQILCRKCNIVIGMANDNTNLLSQAIDYLQKWNN